jgi:hypothetical protein
MLAQNFKSAKELGLKNEYLSALIKTLVLLETGKLEKHENLYDDDGMTTYIPRSGDAKYSGLFNMGEWATNYDCGTVACIGGTAELVGGLKIGELNRLSTSGYSRHHLHDLFFPPIEDCKKFYAEISLEEAAQALRNYLTTGKPKWKEVLKT